MKKSLSFLLLFLALNLSVWATNITVQTASVPNFRVNGIGTNRTGTVTATNGDDDVTCSACLPSNLVGLGGYQILLGATTYYVSSTTSTSAFTLTTNFAGVTGSTSFTLYPTILFRIYSSMDWLPLGSASIIQQGAPGSDNFHQEYAVSVISNTVYLPSLILSATTDAASNIHKNARYSAWFHRMDGARIQGYGGFNSFAVPTTTPTTWAALLTYNTPNITRPMDSSTLSQAQIESLIAASSSISGTAGTLPKITGGGTALIDSNLTQDVSGNLTAGANLAVAGSQTVGGTLTGAIIDNGGRANDVRNYASVNAAVTAIGGSVKTTLLIPTAQTISASVSIPSNITLEFTNTGSLAIASGQTVTIASDRRLWPDRQIFSGSGLVVLSNSGDIYPDWWGALTSSDFGVEVNKALVASAGLSGRQIILTGPYAAVNTSVTVTQDRTHIKGQGRRATLINFTPTTATVLFTIGSASSIVAQSSLSDLSVYGSGTYRKIGVDLINNSEVDLLRLDMQGMTSSEAVYYAAGSISASSSTLTVSGAAFTNAMTGKTVHVGKAGTGGANLVATATYVNATTLTLSTPAVETVSSANVIVTPNTASPSIGIRSRAREKVTIDTALITADRPISFEANPAVPTASSDSSTLRNLYTLAALNGESHLHFADSTVFSNVTLEGVNNFIYGKNGVYWNNTGSSANGLAFRLANIRSEQSQDQTGYGVYVNGYQLSELLVENVRPDLYAQGIYLKNISSATVTNFSYNGLKEAFTSGGGLSSVVFINPTFSSGSTTTLTDLTEVLNTTAHGGSSGVRVFHTTLTPGLVGISGTLSVVDSINGGSVANADLRLQGTTNGTRTSSYLTLQENGGKVGVGVATPTATLDVFSATARDGVLVNGNTRPSLTFIPSSGATTQAYIDQTADVWSIAAKDVATIFRLNLTAPDGSLNIAASGNTGLGTTAPDKKLEINSATGATLRHTYNDSNGSATNYVDESVSSGGNFTITPSGGIVNLASALVMSGTPQTISGNGAITAINLTTDATLIVTTGAATTTLAAGSEGQYKTIKMKTDGGDMVITVTNLLGGTTITMNDAGDFVYLRYLDGQWIVLQNSGCTIA